MSAAGVAPVVAGQLMTTASLCVPLVVGAAFHRLPPPEEKLAG